MKLGMVGLPNVGKSTLFNAITNAGAESANYPFCTIEPNVGTVCVPDKRLDSLAKMYNPKKFTPAILEFVDIAGLVKGASKGEGLGNKFLSNIREVDAIVHVVRCFEDTNIIHVDGEIGPSRDVETINLELVFCDLEILNRRIEKTTKAIKSDKKLIPELDLCLKIKECLEDGKSARSLDLSDDEKAISASFQLLSLKPVIYAANMCEEDFANDIESNKYYKELCDIAKAEHSGIFPICAKIEEEISDMPLEDKQMFLSELNLDESGLDRIIKEGYSILGLISFLTAGEPEVRAWTITKGTKAPQAAGKIHTDFERGFIRAEIVG
ncbi:MAG: redox-regulated ATPase YchF, partial [Oscillospiraceae bacterium]